MTDKEWRQHCMERLKACNVQIIALPSGVMKLRTPFAECVVADLQWLTRDDLRRICRTG